MHGNCTDHLFYIWENACFNPLAYYSVQFSSIAQSCPTLCDPMNRSSQASLSITNSRSSFRLASIESVMPSSHLILCRPLLFLPPILPRIRVFSNESTLGMRWPKYWSFRVSIIPSKEIPGLISFRMDWLDLLAWYFFSLSHCHLVVRFLYHYFPFPFFSFFTHCRVNICLLRSKHCDGVKNDIKEEHQ